MAEHDLINLPIAIRTTTTWLFGYEHLKKAVTKGFSQRLSFFFAIEKQVLNTLRHDSVTQRNLLQGKLKILPDKIKPVAVELVNRK